MQIEFEVKDNDMFGADRIGVAKVEARRIASGETIDEWIPLIGPQGRPYKPETAIRLQITFTPCSSNPVYQYGVTEDNGLRESYFPLRHGGEVTLYQDAHVPDRMLLEIEVEGGLQFEHEKCWEDICHAIMEAHHIVYILGRRMSLWAEHLGQIHPCYKDANELECVNYVNTVAQENWKRFTADKFTALQGHLLKYPVEIDADGKVNSLPGFESFPDVGGKVLGAPTNLPDVWLRMMSKVGP